MPERTETQRRAGHIPASLQARGAALSVGSEAYQMLSRNCSVKRAQEMDGERTGELRLDPTPFRRRE